MRDTDLVSSGKLLSSSGALGSFVAEMDRVESALPSKISADPEGVEKGLAKLVLTVIELVRQLMERQALHRIENGTLTDNEIERLGDTFLKLDVRMGELKEAFGLAGEELNLNLGPLGDLM
jgi:hypothetical protein